MMVCQVSVECQVFVECQVSVKCQVFMVCQLIVLVGIKKIATLEVRLPDFISEVLGSDPTLTHNSVQQSQFLYRL